MLNRMQEGDFLTKADYATAFAQVRAGNGVLNGAIIWQYMQHDPVNAVYLQTEAVKLARETLEQNLNASVSGYQSPYVIWHETNNTQNPIGEDLMRRTDVLERFDTCMKSPTAINDQRRTYITFHDCVFCRDIAISHITTMTGVRDIPLLHGMFDTEHTNTLGAISRFLAQTGQAEPLTLRPMGVCRHCRIQCNECAKPLPMPHISFQELSSYFQEHLCSRCMHDTLITLSVPKPSRTDLRTYQVKFTSLRKGG